MKKAEAEAESIKLLVEQTNVQGGMEVLQMRLTQDYIANMRSLASKDNSLVVP